jgi:REP element-mobilizing transposase RayT
MSLGYLLTFGTYGTHLYGDERGSWRAKTGFVEPDEALNAFCSARRKEAPFMLSDRERRLVLDAMINVAAFRAWTLRAAHVRTDHVHCVVVLPLEMRPFKAIADFKSYASRALREHGVQREHYWAQRGHYRVLRTSEAVSAASEYVYDRQGEAMARYSFDPVGR